MTELMWDGKYDKDGKKQGPVRIALPFQTIETVNEDTEARNRSLDLFAAGRETEWRNRLIWGDKKYVLPSLLPEFAGKVNLIYIDPPFYTGANFSFTATIPRGEIQQASKQASNESQEAELEFTKEPSILEQKAYRDTWGRGLESYLQWFYEAAIFFSELLADDGSLYVHLDWRLVHYVRSVLDEVIGYDSFQREIIWRIGWISGYKSIAKNWIRNHETLLFYSKDPKRFTFNKRYIPYPEGYERWGGRQKGQGYPIEDMWGVFEREGVTSLQVVSFSGENTGYPTQKPEGLLRRVIEASSNEGDLVLDCFMGSGTTVGVAEKMNRKWIGCDLSRFSIHTARKRLLGIPNVRPFVVQNLGKYERQAWAVAEFPSAGADKLEEQRQRETAYRQFILELYRARPISGHTWLHGAKGGRMVHVGTVDAPVTKEDVKAIARETWKAVGSGKDAPTTAGADILGWEFSLELNELAKQVAAEARVDVAFKKIPREVLDKKAVEQGDIHFFELGALAVETKQDGRETKLKLADFVIPMDDIPEEARKAIKHWSQLIDYWAVDWDYKNDTFHNQWQSYRTRKNPKIELESKYRYAEPGKYTVVVKVIDILGNDTTKVVEVQVQ